MLLAFIQIHLARRKPCDPISGIVGNRTPVRTKRPVLSLRGLFALELEVKFVVATTHFSDGVFIFIKAIYSAVMVSAFEVADEK